MLQPQPQTFSPTIVSTIQCQPLAGFNDMGVAVLTNDSVIPLVQVNTTTPVKIQNDKIIGTPVKFQNNPVKIPSTPVKIAPMRSTSVSTSIREDQEIMGAIALVQLAHSQPTPVKAIQKAPR